MLIQLIAEHPQALGTVLAKTPFWVWGMLAALLALGLSQAIDRTMSLKRVSIMPFAMAAFSLWGTIAAFMHSTQFGAVLVATLASAAAMAAIVAPLRAPAGTTYNPVNRTFTVPGSWVPMAMIVGIFLTKYVVGVELAMRPSLAFDGQYTLVVGALYGAFTGMFFGRAARLWRLALRKNAAVSFA